MGTEPTPATLAEILPGRWQIRASNLLHWLTGERLDPVVELILNSAKPLILGELVQFATSDGKERVVRSRSIWNGHDFVTRKLGMRPSARRWTVPGTSEDGNVIVVRHGSGRSAGGGIDVLVREDSGASEIRALIARESENFELSLEDFASLNWLPVPAGGRP